MVMEKRGQGLSMSTLILIIIGVVILVVLIFGVTSGFGGIRGWLAPSGNVDKVVSECRAACASNFEYGFCEEKRDVVFEDEKEVSFTCFTLWYLFWELGFERCEDVRCDNLDCENDLGGVWVKPVASGNKDALGKDMFRSNCPDVEKIVQSSKIDLGNVDDKTVWFFNDADVKMDPGSYGRTRKVGGGLANFFGVDFSSNKGGVCCYLEAEGL